MASEESQPPHSTAVVAMLFAFAVVVQTISAQTKASSRMILRSTFIVGTAAVEETSATTGRTSSRHFPQILGRHPTVVRIAGCAGHAAIGKAHVGESVSSGSQRPHDISLEQLAPGFKALVYCHRIVLSWSGPHVHVIARAFVISLRIHHQSSEKQRKQQKCLFHKHKVFKKLAIIMQK